MDAGSRVKVWVRVDDGVQIRVEFGEFRVENGVRKGSLILNRRCKIAENLRYLYPKQIYKLGLLCTELGFGVFMKVVDMNVSFNWALM
ncbi:hypothetical protein MTR_0290s0050 [Medicago truncatula]|uniref:Uncharacterized protein n=1 Tax=Medicago truncatula TaxID=3880 RepID=A0A072TRH4_MEDTR|nr:hypothetical protein MTR_0290s0050 [Medicago truncatula]